MIITRTPLRISFAGGGSDLPAFSDHEPGAVLSATIDKYIYVSVNDKFGGGFRLSYSKTENVANYKELQHDIARETIAWMDPYGNVKGLEIASIADVPSGTGLGSSSAFAVGLLYALNQHYTTDPLDPSILAMDANYIEHDLCKHPVGKQDHYSAAYGGLRYYEFSGTTAHLYDSLDATKLESNLLLLYVGMARDANRLLSAQVEALASTTAKLTTRRMANIAKAMAHDLSAIGELLNEAWLLKRSLVAGISTPAIDDLYAKAIKAGAIGGKLCGAGGGGFMLFYVEPDKRQQVIDATGLSELPFKLTGEGSTVIYRD